MTLQWLCLQQRRALPCRCWTPRGSCGWSLLSAAFINLLYLLRRLSLLIAENRSCLSMLLDLWPALRRSWDNKAGFWSLLASPNLLPQRWLPDRWLEWLFVAPMYGCLALWERFQPGPPESFRMFQLPADQYIYSHAVLPLRPISTGSRNWWDSRT